MATLKSLFYASDVASDVQGEYRALISIGKPSEEAESLLFSYYCPDKLCNPDAVIFWPALAFAEWNLGRLSTLVQEKAIHCVDLILQSSTVCLSNEKQRLFQELQELLLSPMPMPKKLRKPTVHHCPWKVGSLLAYRIVSEDSLREHPCFQKYALLRVVKIDKKSISRLAPTDLYDEAMRVSLYGWIGDRLPATQFVDSLEYIPIYSQTKEMWVYLDWLPTKFARGDITLLGCDDDFESHIPDVLDFHAMPYTLTHFLSFDVILSQVLLPYLSKSRNANV